MSTKKYHSLNYDHTEINLLLSKIEKYKVLTEEEYQHLFVTIGLSKIDQALETIKENKESYELLLKKHEYDKNYLTGCIDAINKALEDQQKIDSNIEELIADLEARVENYYDFVVNLEDGLVVLDEEFKKALRAELDEVINLLNEQEIKTTELTETKADTNHKHNTKDIENFEGDIEPIRITTYGVIIQRTKECITVAQNYSTYPRQVSSLMTIPKGCIKKIVELKDK